MEDRYGKLCPLGVYTLDLFRMRGLCALALCGGRLTGVVIFRKIKLSKFDPRDHTSHDPRGDCAFVCELCADDAESIRELEAQMRKTLGKCEHIGMCRRGKVKFYNYKRYIKKLLGKGKKA